MSIDFNQPQIIAALFGGGVAAIVSLVVAGFNQLSVRLMHKEKLRFDQEQSERRVTAEIALAKKKLEFDQGLANWKRRHELAEQTLIVFYEARDALNFARSRIIFRGEGASRQPSGSESEEVRKQRESYFVPLERLNSSSEVFARLQALRYTFAAHFGEPAIKPFVTIMGAHNSIASAATILMDSVSTYEHPMAVQSLMPLRDVLGWGSEDRPNKMDADIHEAIVAIEHVCRPVLADRSHV